MRTLEETGTCKPTRNPKPACSQGNALSLSQSGPQAHYTGILISKVGWSRYNLLTSCY